LSEEMVKVGVAKLQRKGIEAKMMVADAENLPFEECEFEALTCAFGVRNFGNLSAGLSEMRRVVSKGGKIAILEYSRNQRKNLWTALFNLYFKKILPFIGGVISRNRAAYQYLPDSVDGFCTNDEFIEKLNNTGFINCKAKTYMGGIVTLFTANTPL
ncbi:MAG: class I SAM-dependent methyltransferase, partial [Rikenellaceae bacterium]